ncbi:hypothetical protein FQZ97_898080 [compost metagenome]
MQRDGGNQGQPGGGHPRRRQGRGQPRPELRQRLLPVEDHVRRRPPDPAAAAHERRRLRQAGRISADQLGSGLRHHGAEIQGGPEAQRPRVGRHVRFRAMDRMGGLRRQQADESGPAQQQYRPQRAPLHGLGGDGLYAHLRRGRTHGLLRRYRSGRCLCAVGLEYGRNAPNSLEPGHRPSSEPAADPGGGTLHL